MLLTSPKARLPLRHKNSAGYDLFLPNNFEFFPGQTIKINTCVKMQIPDGYYGQILNKSSISTNYNLIVLGGVIDNDYQGDIYVCIRNIGDKIIMLPTGCAIAQIVFLKYATFKITPVEKFSKSSKRGSEGFGSSTPLDVNKKIKVYNSVKDYVHNEFPHNECCDICDFSDDGSSTTSADLGDYDLDKYAAEKQKLKDCEF